MKRKTKSLNIVTLINGHVIFNICVISWKCSSVRVMSLSINKKSLSTVSYLLFTVSRSYLTRYLSTHIFPCNDSGGACQMTQRVTVYTLPVLLKTLRWKLISIQIMTYCMRWMFFSVVLAQLLPWYGCLLIRLVKNGPNCGEYINK